MRGTADDRMEMEGRDDGEEGRDDGEEDLSGIVKSMTMDSRLSTGAPTEVIDGGNVLPDDENDAVDIIETGITIGSASNACNRCCSSRSDCDSCSIASCNELLRGGGASRIISISSLITGPLNETLLRSVLSVSRADMLNEGRLAGGALAIASNRCALSLSSAENDI